jgi:hypothetical protein
VEVLDLDPAKRSESDYIRILNTAGYVSNILILIRIPESRPRTFATGFVENIFHLSRITCSR